MAAVQQLMTKQPDRVDTKQSRTSEKRSTDLVNDRSAVEKRHKNRETNQASLLMMMIQRKRMKETSTVKHDNKPKSTAK